MESSPIQRFWKSTMVFLQGHDRFFLLIFLPILIALRLGIFPAMGLPDMPNIGYVFGAAFFFCVGQSLAVTHKYSADMFILMLVCALCYFVRPY